MHGHRQNQCFKVYEDLSTFEAMDLHEALDNESKWRHFLSSIKRLRYIPTNSVTIKTKTNTKCLANTFANKLLQRKGGTVKLKGAYKILNQYQHLAPPQNKAEILQQESNIGFIHDITDVDKIGYVHKASSIKPESYEILSSSESSNENSESLLKSYKDKQSLDPWFAHTEGPPLTKVAKLREESISDVVCVNESNPTNIPQSKTEEPASVFERQSKIDMVDRQEITSLHVSANNITYITDAVEIERTRDRDEVIYSPTKKTDIDKPCSQWTIRNIAEYFMFDDCVFELKFPETLASITVNSFESVQKHIISRLKIVSGADLTKRKRKETDVTKRLKSIACTETGSRLILDSVLVPLCSELGLRIEVDKNINCNFLPNCRFDYCILKGEHIIGCLEAKSVKTLSDTSVAQAILQLLILQTNIISEKSNDVDVDYFPLFAIVSDGQRYIFIQLVGESLRFEHDGDKVKVREVLDEEDFKIILQHISFLVGKNHTDHPDVILID